MTVQLIRRTAKELAASFFENEDTFGDGRYIRTDTFRNLYGNTDKGQRAFVQEHWPDFVKLARKLLAHQLTLPGTTQIQKDAIYDALLTDQNRRTDEDMIAPSILRMN